MQINEHALFTRKETKLHNKVQTSFLKEDFI